MWRSSIGRKRSASGGITGLDDDIEDQPALPEVRLSFCPY